jgi:hypothetical protein
MKKCAFCTSIADSEEHVFSTWMLKTLPRGERINALERLASGEFVTYPKKKIRLVAKVVCRACNNNWMSELENNHAKVAMGHLFTNETRCAIGTRDLVSMSAYAFKTLVLANHKNLTSTPFFPYSIRRRFRTELAIPDGVQVWLARRGRQHTIRCNWNSSFGKSSRKTKNSFSYYVLTWNFQNVILQVLAGKWDGKEKKRTMPFPLLPQDPYWEQSVSRIWPPTGNSVMWPPPLNIGDDTYDAFSNRWESISLTTH